VLGSGWRCMPYLAIPDGRAPEPVSSTPMGRHSLAARLFVVVTVFAMLVGTSSFLARRPDPRPVRTPDRSEGWVVHPPQLEGLLSNVPRLSVSELRRGIERRPLPISAALAALGLLGIGLLSWRFPLKPAGGQPTYSARSRVAGPRAPPLQLV
jgi:hypothetical protein